MSEILGHVLAPLPILLVGIGAGLIALAQHGWSTLFSAFAALKPLLVTRPDADRDGARAVLHRAEEVAHLQGLARTDRVRTAHPFIADALITLANAPDVEHFDFWANSALADRQERHGRAIDFWNAIADAAPAVGMAGTILGLIGMFARMSDPATIGPSMALALMSTLDGMILASVIAGPIANRLTQLSRRELAWQREVVDRMSAIARREGAPVPRQSARERALV